MDLRFSVQKNIDNSGQKNIDNSGKRSTKSFANIDAIIRGCY